MEDQIVMAYGGKGKSAGGKGGKGQNGGKSSGGSARPAEHVYNLKVKTSEGYRTIGTVDKWKDSGNLTASLNVPAMEEFLPEANDKGFINNIALFEPFSE